MGPRREPCDSPLRLQSDAIYVPCVAAKNDRKLRPRGIKTLFGAELGSF